MEDDALATAADKWWARWIFGDTAVAASSIVNIGVVIWYVGAAALAGWLVLRWASTGPESGGVARTAFTIGAVLFTLYILMKRRVEVDVGRVHVLEARLMRIQDTTLAIRERVRAQKQSGPFDLNARGPGVWDPSPVHFHHDADLVNIVYAVLEYAEANPEEFERMVHFCDEVLRLADVRPMTRDVVERMHEYRKRAMNHYATFIHGIPNIDRTAEDKFIRAADRLHTVLLRQVDGAARACSDPFLGAHIVLANTAEPVDRTVVTVADTTFAQF